MADPTAAAVRRTSGGTRRWWRRWPAWICYAAFAWCLGYGALALYWAFGGVGFPYGGEDEVSVNLLSLFGQARPESTGPVIAGLCLVGALVALAMARPWGQRVPRAALLTFSVAASVVLLLVIPDGRMLMVLAYGAMMFFGAVDWTTLNQILSIVGGLLWVGASLACYRRSRNACTHCGRTGSAGHDHQAAGSVRLQQWGRIATYVAVIAPLPYALTRWAWSFGSGIGLSEEFYRFYTADMAAKGGGFIDLTLGAMAIGGAILTLGLTQRWGEVFPRWMPGLAGRRVPPGLAVVPALLAAIILSGAGLSMWRGLISGGFDWSNWGAGGPTLLWLPWGIALVVAAVAYYYRRRGRCRHCEMA